MATKKPHHHIPLRGAVRSDLAWWDTFLESWNGVAIIPSTMPVAPPHQVYTDAAGGFGCGAIWGRHWFQYMWPSAFQGQATATQELLPIVMACMIWGPWWANNRVVVHCDNQAAVCVVNAGYSRDKDMMHLMHCLFLSGHTVELTYGQYTFQENRMLRQMQSHVVTSLPFSRCHHRSRPSQP